MVKRAKNLLQDKPKEKIIKLPISRFIDTKYREYATYVLQSRGIPDFHDALTPVQRYILKSAPLSFVKSLTVVGRVIEQGYHHGDFSLGSALNRLARPFGNSLQLLDGYGFFGSEVSPEASASRYTSVRLSSQANGIINRYSHLTTKEPDGPYDPLWMDVPIGLVIPIIGIAIGYKTTILPRKLDDIQKFLEGKIKTLKPYFTDFNGTIQKYKGMDKSWLVTSKMVTENNRIQIREIPPIVKYSSLIKRLDTLYSRYESKIKVLNNSNTKVNIDIIYTGNSKEEFKEIGEFVYKIFSIIVSENIVFIKDGQVLVYDRIEDYLEDYKWQVLRLRYRDCEHEFGVLNFDLTFNVAKEKFIEFILQKKRNNQEITTFLKPYDKEISEKLERMTSRKFTSDELAETKALIKQLKMDLKEKEKELKEKKLLYENVEDPTLKRGISSRKNTVNLLDDVEDSKEDENGITIWNGEDMTEDEGEKETPEE